MPLNNSKKYTLRTSYRYRGQHINDNFINLGFDYKGKILRKVTSPELWANPIQVSFYKYLESLILFLIEQVKEIKKTYSIAHAKNNLNIN